MTNDTYIVEPFKPADAEGVSRLFSEVYGDRYPVRTVYEPDQLIAASRGGRYFPFCVHDRSGKVIGYGALNSSAPFRGIYEFVQGVVSPDCQGGGIGTLLFEFVEKYMPTLPHCEVYFGEAVCNHIHTQKAGALIKTIETGIEVDLLPGNQYGKRDDAPVRVAAVDMFRTFVPKPQVVYVPAVYDEIARYIYGGFDDSRTIRNAAGPETGTGPLTQMSVSAFESAHVARISVPVVGPDFMEQFNKEQEMLAGRDIRVIQAWLNISRPVAAAMTEELRRHGYFFGAFCPRWFDEDCVLMQRIIGDPDWDHIHLYSGRSGKILEFIRSDWKETAGTEREAPHE